MAALGRQRGLGFRVSEYVPDIYIYIYIHMGDCQNYGLFLGPNFNMGPNTGPNLGNPKRDHNFDNPPYIHRYIYKDRPQTVRLNS